MHLIPAGRDRGPAAPFSFSPLSQADLLLIRSRARVASGLRVATAQGLGEGFRKVPHRSIRWKPLFSSL